MVVGKRFQKMKNSLPGTSSVPLCLVNSSTGIYGVRTPLDRQGGLQLCIAKRDADRRGRAWQYAFIWLKQHVCKRWERRAWGSDAVCPAPPPCECRKSLMLNSLQPRTPRRCCIFRGNANVKKPANSLIPVQQIEKRYPANPWPEGSPGPRPCGTVRSESNCAPSAG